jgi:hypothetical protein
VKEAPPESRQSLPKDFLGIAATAAGATGGEVPGGRFEFVCKDLAHREPTNHVRGTPQGNPSADTVIRPPPGLASIWRVLVTSRNYQS